MVFCRMYTPLQSRINSLHEENHAKIVDTTFIG
jgi:hypothetical protein